jgi:outer membrane protein assembly factor BamB
MLRSMSSFGMFFATIFAAGGAMVFGDDWPQFLGPGRSGLSAETGLLDEWPEEGLREVWRVPGGVGMSGLAIARGRLFTLIQRDGKQWLVAKSAATGEDVWATPLAEEYENAMGNGPRGTPSVAGDTIFAFTGEGVLAACRFDDGKLLWSRSVVEELKGEPAEYGMACSPLVVGDKVIVHAGAPGATVAAYDAQSGNLAWTAGDDSAAGYSSPTLLKLAGREIAVSFTGDRVLGLNPEDGQVLFEYPYKTDYDCNIAAPLATDGRLFISAGENHGSSMLAIESKDGKLAASEVWSSHGPTSNLRCEWQTAALLDGYLYGMDNVGGAGPVTHLACIEAATGKRAWRQNRFGKGNFILADGKLFMTTIAGEIIVARASPDSYQELGRQTAIGATRQAPSLADGLLYVRDDEEIACFDIRKVK